MTPVRGYPLDNRCLISSAARIIAVSGSVMVIYDLWLLPTRYSIFDADFITNGTNKRMARICLHILSINLYPDLFRLLNFFQMERNINHRGRGMSLFSVSSVVFRVDTNAANKETMALWYLALQWTNDQSYRLVAFLIVFMPPALLVTLTVTNYAFGRMTRIYSGLTFVQFVYLFHSWSLST